MGRLVSKKDYENGNYILYEDQIIEKLNDDYFEIIRKGEKEFICLVAEAEFRIKQYFRDKSIESGMTPEQSENHLKEMKNSRELDGYTWAFILKIEKEQGSSIVLPVVNEAIINEISEDSTIIRLTTYYLLTQNDSNRDEFEMTPQDYELLKQFYNDNKNFVDDNINKTCFEDLFKDELKKYKIMKMMSEYVV